LQGQLLRLVRWFFLAAVLASAGFVSCLTAMRFAIRGSEVTVPDLIGKTVGEANRLASLSELQLKLESHRFDDQREPDRIITQTPSPGSKLKINRNVRVVVSLGAKKIAVPDLRGESLRTTQIALLSRGLTLGVTSTIHSVEMEKDRIISQDPLPLTRLARSPRVSVLVSAGAPSRTYVMPNLVGDTLEEVSSSIGDSGLKLGAVNYHFIPSLPKGTILKQNPPPGFRLVEGNSVDLEVCR
jgi:eukaryotic-like serine/threonine-protein kinase